MIYESIENGVKKNIENERHRYRSNENEWNELTFVAENNYFFME